MTLALATHTQKMIDTIKSELAGKKDAAGNDIVKQGEATDIITNDELVAFQNAMRDKPGLNKDTQDAVDFTNKELTVDSTGTTKFAAADQYGADPAHNLGGKVDGAASVKEIDGYNIFTLINSLGIKARNGS